VLRLHRHSAGLLRRIDLDWSFEPVPTLQLSFRLQAGLAIRWIERALDHFPDAVVRLVS